MPILHGKAPAVSTQTDLPSRRSWEQLASPKPQGQSAVSCSKLVLLTPHPRAAKAVLLLASGCLPRPQAIQAESLPRAPQRPSFISSVSQVPSQQGSGGCRQRALQLHRAAAELSPQAQARGGCGAVRGLLKTPPSVSPRCCTAGLPGFAVLG